MQTIQKRIGARIKELRKQNGISQEVFAEKAGIDKKYLSDIECGKRNLSIQMMEVIAITFNLGLYGFFNCKTFNQATP